MSAPTKKLITKGGHVVICKEYLSGKERRAINSVIFGSVNITMEGKTPKMSELPASISNLIEDETIKQSIVSVDGKTENVLDLCLELPEEEYAEVVAFLETAKQIEEKKTN